MVRHLALLGAAVALAVVIVLGFGLGFVFDPLSGARPGNPIPLSVPSGKGNCADNYPPSNSAFVNNASREQLFIVFLMNASSVAKLCIAYYPLSATSLPVSASLPPSIFVSPQEGNSSSTTMTTTFTYETASGIIVTANPATLVLNRSSPDEFVTFTITSNDSSRGFYLFESPYDCPFYLPLVVGYPASNVSSLNFQRDLPNPILQNSGCGTNGLNADALIVGTTGMSVLYVPVAGGPNIP